MLPVFRRFWLFVFHCEFDTVPHCLRYILTAHFSSPLLESNGFALIQPTAKDDLFLIELHVFSRSRVPLF